MGREPLTITNEKQLQRLVKDMAEKLGWLTYHTKNAMQSDKGFPDLVCAHPKHGVLFLELKVNAKVTREQEMWIDTLVQAGQFADYVFPADTEAGAWLERVLTGEQPIRPSDKEAR